ncbi:hypothetical protein DBT_0054 [Dissulfuribacter thermophilus]|uniref:Uncharacterized protein n=1 Tax=Dissulfuribacter thermophilus TaxID=1156395 RepID=A0A1B9F8H4_9BACT|nr:outer membrane protein assembly factor BamD [Dissulfuribacter thermophilus]OCC16237.1 hypothetical protein DBT_0054 [Dissulfuribacter thermophilus]
MEAVTFPDNKVVEFIESNFIPVRIAFDAKPLSEEFNVKWTPTIITLDDSGKEHHRTVGFLSSEELIPSLNLGIGKGYFEKDELKEALKWFEHIVIQYPKSDFTPEALFLKGVVQYKLTQDPKPLKEAYEDLTKNFPDSEWTKRAYPYRLL